LVAKKVVIVEYGAKETTHRTDKKKQVCTA